MSQSSLGALNLHLVVFLYPNKGLELSIHLDYPHGFEFTKLDFSLYNRVNLSSSVSFHLIFEDTSSSFFFSHLESLDSKSHPYLTLLLPHNQPLTSHFPSFFIDCILSWF